MSEQLHSNHILRLGLTGGIGSGKSTVAQFLSEAGAGVIDADAISRATTAPQGSAIAAIQASFGAQYITSEGALDRDAMRALVFADASAKRQLEAIVHPLVAAEIQTQTAQAIRSGHRVIVFDVPLLVESGKRWRSQVDRVLLIDCTVQLQIERVMARNGLSKAAVEQIIQAQAPRSAKLAAADWVIYNESKSFEDLRAKVLSLPLQKPHA